MGTCPPPQGGLPLPKGGFEFLFLLLITYYLLLNLVGPGGLEPPTFRM